MAGEACPRPQITGLKGILEIILTAGQEHPSPCLQDHVSDHPQPCRPLPPPARTETAPNTALPQDRDLGSCFFGVRAWYFLSGCLLNTCRMNQPRVPRVPAGLHTVTASKTRVHI